MTPHARNTDPERAAADSTEKAEAFYSDKHRCWFIPVSPELLSSEAHQVVEPCRLELKDKQLWITRLEDAPR